MYNELSVLDLVGNTPLVRLNRMADADMATVLAKAEFLNPTGSVKDRVGKHMIEVAERSGRLRPGGTVIESSAGNTGLSLALLANRKGYRSVITIPDKMSNEKIDMLKAFGAEVVVTRSGLPHTSPDHYVQVAKRIAADTPNSIYMDQFFAPSNTEAHYLTTGPEIWQQTEGRIDCFVAAAGTGGTISGVGKFLKEQASKIGSKVNVLCPDPVGSIYYDIFYASPNKEAGSYKVEGIGNDILVGNLDLTVIDEMRKVSDRDAFMTARRLAKEEGLFVGGSSGVNVFSALEVARELGPGKVVVTMLTDSGSRYMSKFFNDGWMKELGYLDLDSRLGRVEDLLLSSEREVQYVKRSMRISEVVQLMQDTGFSQIPLVPVAEEGFRVMDESEILQALVSGICSPEDLAETFAVPLESTVRMKDPISKLEKLFESNKTAFVVDRGKIFGVVSKIDLVRYIVTKG